MALKLTEGEGSRQGSLAVLDDPAIAAVHVRPPQKSGVVERFESTDPKPGRDLARIPLIGRVLKNRKFQFFLILPNQIIFWIVIVSGLVGTLVPGKNFGTAITWFIWFCMVFVTMLVVGRAWCSMCPFGGFGEWVQRRALWRRASKSVGLGWKLPESWAGYGLLISTGVFLFLTWVEEYFNIAGPGTPSYTSWMVVGIVTVALGSFLLFERRTFCRYICPLSSLIGSVGASGMVAGFRTRDREKCLACATKDCMRGGENGYGCPWYTWPGSADSNLLCGLCSECYKSCPEDNVGLFVQAPLTSAIAPKRRRLDVAWAIAVLFGLVLYQQVNVFDLYSQVEGWFNSWMHFPHYPNPLVYLGFIFGATAVLAGLVWVLWKAFGLRSPGGSQVAGGSLAGDPAGSDRALVPAGTSSSASGSSATATATLTAQSTPKVSSVSQTAWREWFMPIMYGFVPVMASDYLARQLPKFFFNALDVIQSVVGPFGFHSSLYGHQMLSATGVVRVQLGVVAAGTAGSLYTMWRIGHREFPRLTAHPAAVRVLASAIVIATGAIAFVLYIGMHAAP